MKWLLGTVVLAICVLHASSSERAPEIAYAASVQTHVVVIHGYAFMPQHLVINAGDTVLWVNKDADKHTVTSDGKTSTGSRSRPLGSGARYGMTFGRSGTFRYHCEFHPFMRGTVKVRAHATA